MNLRAIHQIEITSRCNLRCRYCVHPTMAREKRDMDERTFMRALEVAEVLHYQYGHRELNLAGIGESTMHPYFIDYLEVARRTLPEEVDLVLATNGLLVDDDLAHEMARAMYELPGRLLVWVSLHRPERAGPAVEALRRYGLLAGVSADPSVAAVNWAGQVNWHVSVPGREPCPWLSHGLGFVAADGSVLQCCFDGSGASRLGDIWEPVGSQAVRAHALCPACHHTVPAHMQALEIGAAWFNCPRCGNKGYASTKGPFCTACAKAGVGV